VGDAHGEEGGSVMFVSTEDDVVWIAGGHMDEAVNPNVARSKLVGLVPLCRFDSSTEERGPASDVGRRICETVFKLAIAAPSSAVVTTFLFLLGKLFRWGSMNPFPLIRLST